MLNLTRKLNEDILIGTGADTVVVRLVLINRNQATIGIIAPDNVSIDRREVREARECQFRETPHDIRVRRLEAQRAERERREQRHGKGHRS